ncbi:hypothetical protein B0T17DRAFT_586932 [Bombardia bombarda]|uniref:DUF676 domain-containing protein n=1 Tax=Bombardia bombarda TaxID=252184 RepID=A0AA39XKM1_9PEZI|nr:hypothetical protein B0T17DRAFT_586932 [Bombardia bombarda]
MYHDANTHWKSIDPRTSSTQSLRPSMAHDEQRRTLLFIYIHGFMGNDSSFRSFPAHVHSYLKDALQETHVIHSKIYPRYKTYKAIDVARDRFSSWLEPHESPSTDVILVGHSMGGVLAAEVALKPRQGVPYGPPFQHRILGTISLDAPLLGLHPGIVVSGIASLFRPAPSPPGAAGAAGGSTESSTPLGSEPPGSLSPYSSIYSDVAPPSGVSSPNLVVSPSSSSSVSYPAPPDPYFNPPFFNDVSFVDRGWLKNIAHFANKHKQENLFEAAANHIVSHLEFGSCLADYPSLKARYSRLRSLEDVDDLNQPAGSETLVRVRFVNYYTASTGLPKKPKKPTSPGPDPGHPPQTLNVLLEAPAGPQETSSFNNTRSPDAKSSASTPRISLEDHSDHGNNHDFLSELDPVPELDDEPPPYAQDDAATTPTPTQPSSITTTNSRPTTGLTNDPNTSGQLTTTTTTDLDLQLPPVPDLPVPPQAPDLTKYTDKEARKQVEKEAKRAKKAYDQAVKDRDKIIKERQKFIEKRQRKAAKDAEKAVKDADKERKKAEQLKQKQLQKEGQELQKELEALRVSGGGGEQQQQQNQPREKDKEEKKKKLRKFCMLPSKVNGLRDPTWVQVYMEDVDEVGAHCGLFFPGPHYEKLVGDVGERVVGWVQEDASRRAIFDFDLD